MAKQKFVIAPHMRLHEWVAEEKGYFKEEGLDYVYSNPLVSKAGKVHDLGDKVGAYQTYEAGRIWRRLLGLSLDGERGRCVGPRAHVPRRLLGLSLGDFRAAGIQGRKAPKTLPVCRSRWASSRAAITRRSRRWSSG